MMRPIEWLHTTEAREIERLTLQVNTLEARFNIVMGFLIKQFPVYFAADHDQRGVDPTLNPIALPITQEESDAINATLAEMHVDNEVWMPDRTKIEDYTVA